MAGTGLADKVALVTGGSRGLGRQIATVFAREGARVVVAARSTRRDSGGSSTAVAEAIREAGGDALAVDGDVSIERDVQQMVTAARHRFGRLDILVNNAATRLSTTVLDTSSSEMERIFRVNVLGPFYLWKHVLPTMAEQGGGNVINLISTNLPRQPFIGMAPYRMTKAALAFLSVDLASEVADQRIAVNAFDPGPIGSDGTAEIRAERERRYGIRIPYHALDAVEVIDESIVWLASQTAATFTGQVVRRIEFGTTWGPGSNDPAGPSHATVLRSTDMGLSNPKGER